AGPGGGLAAGQGADAEHELGEVEGFGQVVVGAEAEPADPVVAGAGGGEHEGHGRPVAFGDHLAEGVAVDAGQVAVEHDDLVGVGVEFGGGVDSVVGDVDGETLVAQPFGHVVGQAVHVFHDQDPHVLASAVSAG